MANYLYSQDDFRFVFQNEKCYFFSDFQVSHVAIDSREIIPNSCFFAIRGKLNDGHKYIDSVFHAGASLVICEYVNKSLAKYLNEQKINAIIVNDTQDALVRLAKYRRSQIKGKVIAITGSIGKTTTKENTADILSHFFDKVYRSPKSYNTLLSTPAVIANAPADSKILVLEISMSEPNNQIAFLSKIARPDVACITTIAPAHTMNFGSIDEICQQKTQIFAGLDPEKGVAILNKTSAYYDMMLLEAKGKYGIKNVLNLGTEDSHVMIKEYKFTENFRTEFVIQTNFANKKEEFSANVPGCSYHSAFNTLFPISIAKLLSLDLKQACDSIQYLKTIEGRGNLEKINTENVDVFVINESYNSSPEALKAAISSLGVLGNFRLTFKKIAILGDMFELGDSALDLHLAVVEQILKIKVDLFIAVGPLMGRVADQLSDKIPTLKYDNARDLVQEVRKILFFDKNLDDKNISLKGRNLIVLLKGSNSINLDYVKNKLYR